jgi:hypothetical protein
MERKDRWPNGALASGLARLKAKEAQFISSIQTDAERL